jgi:polar amino acid transport system substrate-binding protein
MKKMYRYGLIAVLLLTLVASLAACSSDKKDEKTEEGDKAKTYVIYSDNAFAPFEFLDQETNTYTGVDMDLLAAIAKNQGFSYTVKNEGFDAAMGAVQSGQADAMIAGMTIRDDRKETFDFSEGYFADGQIFVVGANSTITKLEDLRGAVVAVKTSTAGADYAASIQEEYGFTLQYYEDSPTMYTAVLNGTNVACFEDFSVVGWAIKNDGVALKTIGDVINPGYYGFAVKKGTNPELIEMFNAGLAAIKESGEYDQILEKYGY